MNNAELLNKYGIHTERIRRLDINSGNIAERMIAGKKKPQYILYWMQASQRTECNHALEYAALLANQNGLPLLVSMVLLPSFPGANRRHYGFMMQGWGDIEKEILKRGAGFSICFGEAENIVAKLAMNAAAVVCDCGYSSFQLGWRQGIARLVKCPVYEVESNVVVPLEQVSQREEYAARTIRPKINQLLSDYLVPLKKLKLKCKFSDATAGIQGVVSTGGAMDKLARLPVDQSVMESKQFLGGQKEGYTFLRRFLREGLARYDTDRNFPERDATSHLSPYLHFGQISPLDIALAVIDWGKAEQIDVEPFLEQLVVRRELAMNFCYYNEDCTNYSCLPDWAVKTLRRHENDKRPYVYSREEFEQAGTHDPCWNAAQLQMVKTGHMHNYMRMYWGKKVLEWSAAPQEAFEILHYLNDKYELDGRDPNGWTGIAWCFGKHDRPWPEREMYGTIRSMAASGLKRKFDIGAYVEQWIDES